VYLVYSVNIDNTLMWIYEAQLTTQRTRFTIDYLCVLFVGCKISASTHHSITCRTRKKNGRNKGKLTVQKLKYQMIRHSVELSTGHTIVHVCVSTGVSVRVKNDFCFIDKTQIISLKSLPLIFLQMGKYIYVYLAHVTYVR
jgi:hypothetical protein